MQAVVVALAVMAALWSGCRSEATSGSPADTPRAPGLPLQGRSGPGLPLQGRSGPGLPLQGRSGPGAPIVTGEARALALFPVPPSQNTRATPAEQRLRAAQEAATAVPNKVASWVDVGDAWVLLSRERSDPGFFLHADGAARMALALSPSNPDALRLQAATLLNEHRFAEAATAARAALAKAPDDVLAHGLLSDALLEQGDVAGARAAAEAWLAREPSLGPHARLLWLSFLVGDLDAVVTHAEAALRDPTATAEARAFVAVDAGHVAFWQGDRATARLRFDQALATWPGCPSALVGLGRVHLAEGRPADAVAVLRRAWQAQPLVETGVLLTAALRAGDDTEPAAEALAQEQATLAFARQTDPRSTALWLVEHGARDAAAIAEARRLMKDELRVRDDIYTHDVAAVVALAAGDLDDARRHSDRALALRTPDPRLLAHAGLVRVAQGDASGRALLATALQAGPFDPVLPQQARQALELPP